MRRVFRNILFLINLFFAVCLLLANISVYINPAKFWFIAFFGLAFPYLLIINVGFVIFWLYRIKPHFLLSLLIIVTGWQNISNYVALNKNRNNTSSTNSSYNILSYNVRLLNYYNWNTNKSSRDSILGYLKRQNADIICMQEFFSVEDKNENSWTFYNMISKVGDNLYVHKNFYDYNASRYKYGTVTLSNYPIVNKGIIKFENSWNSCLYSDIKLLEDTIRVYNCHLQSIRFNRNNIRFIDSLKLEYNSQQIIEIKDISRRLRDAFIMRASQVSVIKNHAKRSPYPVIICGDFNDTPVSYTYHKLVKDMSDAFISCGKGIGKTYTGNFPSFRIDYILVNKKMNVHSFERDRCDYSDHYPIRANFSVEP